MIYSCRTKIRLFASSFRGAHSRLTRTITKQKIRALVSAHRDMDKQKINFHRLWITRDKRSNSPYGVFAKRSFPVVSSSPLVVWVGCPSLLRSVRLWITGTNVVE